MDLHADLEKLCDGPCEMIVDIPPVVYLLNVATGGTYLVSVRRLHKTTPDIIEIYGNYFISLDTGMITERNYLVNSIATHRVGNRDHQLTFPNFSTMMSLGFANRSRVNSSVKNLCILLQ